LLTGPSVLLGELDMKTLGIVAVCAVALIAGRAWAQDQPATTVSTTAQPAQDVGGVTDMSRSDAGAPKALTRQQVYQDFLRSEQPGERSHLQDVFRGQ
jgi:hypothetical protein